VTTGDDETTISSNNKNKTTVTVKHNAVMFLCRVENGVKKSHKAQNTAQIDVKEEEEFKEEKKRFF
jgi:hypothetical protein